VAITLFDTHSYVKRLEKSGVPSDQAEAHAKVLADVMNKELLKKSDLDEFRIEVGEKFAEVGTRFTEVGTRFAEIGTRFAEVGTRFAEVETRFTEVKGQFELLKWMLGFMLAGTVTILFKIFN
jgi:hypothetical protein